MPNRRLRLTRPRWSPYASVLILGSTVALCYREYALTHAEFPDATSAFATATPPVSLPTPIGAPTAIPNATLAINARATPVLTTPPLVARATPIAPQAPPNSQPSALTAAPETPRSSFAGGGLVRQGTDFGQPPANTEAPGAKSPTKASASPGSRVSQTTVPKPGRERAKIERRQTSQR